METSEASGTYFKNDAAQLSVIWLCLRIVSRIDNLRALRTEGHVLTPKQVSLFLCM